ncbi:MAG: hypothetical protein QM538_07320 [Methylacidiphilales bacterium]|nr:hypothetical protein [Candidatus Methylacidiphilales bacterium]
MKKLLLLVLVFQSNLALAEGWEYFVGGGFVTNTQYSFDQGASSGNVSDYINQSVNSKGYSIIKPITSNLALVGGFMYVWEDGFLLGGEAQLFGFQEFNDTSTFYAPSDISRSILSPFPFEVTKSIERNVTNISLIIGYAEEESFRVYGLIGMNSVSLSESYTYRTEEKYYDYFNTYYVDRTVTLSTRSITRSVPTIGLGFTAFLGEEASIKIEYQSNRKVASDTLLITSFQYDFR